MPVILEFFELYLELGSEKVPGVPGVVFEHVLHAEELRLVVLDHAGVRSDRGLAVGECR